MNYILINVELSEDLSPRFETSIYCSNYLIYQAIKYNITCVTNISKITYDYRKIHITCDMYPNLNSLYKILEKILDKALITKYYIFCDTVYKFSSVNDKRILQQIKYNVPNESLVSSSIELDIDEETRIYKIIKLLERSD